MIQLGLITLTKVGTYRKTEKFLDNAKDAIRLYAAEEYGRRGLAALRDATPKDTGKTAESWEYSVVREKDKIQIIFTNTNIVDGYYNVAIGLQYGHATKNGYWVEGRDYINPALQPVFDAIAESVWKEIISI